MDIDKLEAGRELDALVWLALNGKAGEMTDQGVLGCRYVDGDIQPYAGYPIGHISPPHYSTDIATAWKVIDELCSQGFIVCLLDQQGYEERANGMLVSMWRCEFMDEGAQAAGRPWGETWMGIARADTASLAICRAALKATTNTEQ